MRAAAPFTGTFTFIEKFKKHEGCPTLGFCEGSWVLTLPTIFHGSVRRHGTAPHKTAPWNTIKTPLTTHHLRLIPELQTHLHMRRNSFPVFLRRLVQVSLHILNCRIPQFRPTGNHRHGFYVSCPLHPPIQVHLSGYIILYSFRPSHPSYSL